MSTEFDGPALSAGEMIPRAMEELTRSQVELLKATRHFLVSPSEALGAELNDRMGAAEQVFLIAAGTIASCSELTVHEQAEHIASICLDTKKVRVDFLRKVAPQIEFPDMPFEKEELIDRFEAYIWMSEGMADVAQEAEGFYEEYFKQDLEKIIDFVGPTSPDTPNTTLAPKKNSMTLKIGVLATAGILGVLAVRQGRKLFGMAA